MRTHAKKLTTFASLLAAGVVTALTAATPAQAALIYTETPTGAGSNNPFASIGWSAYVDSIHNSPASGTFNTTIDISSSATPSLAYLTATGSLIASSSTNFLTHVALISDAAPLNTATYQSDLKISFTENATNAGSNSPPMGWRVLVQTGSNIYASDFFGYSDSASTHDVLVSGNVWHLWTGESDLSNGFDIANIAVAASAIPTGTISKVGVLAIDGAENNDRLRLGNLSITGTLVPEPASIALFTLGGLLIARRRKA